LFPSKRTAEQFPEKSIDSFTQLAKKAVDIGIKQAGFLPLEIEEETAFVSMFVQFILDAYGNPENSIGAAFIPIEAFLNHYMPLN
jgi:hypothetical protein